MVLLLCGTHTSNNKALDCHVKPRDACPRSTFQRHAYLFDVSSSTMLVLADYHSLKYMLICFIHANKNLYILVIINFMTTFTFILLNSCITFQGFLETTVPCCLIQLQQPYQRSNIILIL